MGLVLGSLRLCWDGDRNRLKKGTDIGALSRARGGPPATEDCHLCLVVAKDKVSGVHENLVSRTWLWAKVYAVYVNFGG